MAREMDTIGLSVPPDLREEMDATRERENTRSSRTVSRSEVIRRRYELGRVVENVLDDADLPAMGEQERRALVRSALLEWIDE